MKIINVHEAKTRLSSLLAEIEENGTVRISKPAGSGGAS